jgi:DNA-binding LacI/PurR family transcriptional regulator
MEDVAARAGVSRALVSLVMRGSPKVSDQRRRAVLAAAHDLGYQPHAMARSLASRTSNLVGVLVSDLRNAFFGDVVEGMDAAAQHAGLELILTTGHRNADRERSALERLLSFRPGGIVMLSPALPAATIFAAANQYPLVLVSRTAGPGAIDTVNDDGEAGVALAVDHLMSLGHRRIVHLDGGAAFSAVPRRRGFLSAMRRHGAEPLVVPSEHTDTAGAAAVRQLLRLYSPGGFPTALVCGNDANAIGAMSALVDAGLRVPQDVSIVGYDNSSLAALRHVALTTIDQPRLEIGRLAVDALAERLRHERTEPVRRRVPPALIVRATTAPPRE